MACEICGRSSCTRSFHSIEEQETFDNIKDQVLENLGSSLKWKLERLDTEEIDGKEYIKKSDLDNLIKEML